MSYGFGMSADASRQFQAIDPWLGEQILDELEGVVHDPSILPLAFGDSFIKYRFSRRVGTSFFHITLTLARNDLARFFTVVDIFIVDISP